MEGKEEIRRGKDNLHEGRELNTTYRVMLCVFFYYLFSISIKGAAQLRKSIIPDILQSDSTFTLSLVYLIWVFWIVLGFWSIILALKGSNNAIPCLKLCLPFLFVSFLISGISKTSSFSALASWQFILYLFFPLIFFIYLCSSEVIKTQYPKKNRRLGVPGIFGITLYVGIALLLFFTPVSETLALSHFRHIDPNQIKLYRNELTEGTIIFTADDSWRLDSTVTVDAVEEAFFFRDTVYNSDIVVSSYREEYEPSMHFYIYSIVENVPSDDFDSIEVIGYDGLENDENVVYVDQYRCGLDTSAFYWTYASIISKAAHRSVRLSILEKDTLRTTIDDAKMFLNKSTFDVRSRLFKKNRVNQEDNDDDANEINDPAKSVSE